MIEYGKQQYEVTIHFKDKENIVEEVQGGRRLNYRAAASEVFSSNAYFGFIPSSPCSRITVRELPRYGFPNPPVVEFLGCWDGEFSHVIDYPPYFF